MSEISALAVRARELLAYDPGTGEFRWRKSRGRAKAGEIAGTLNEIGYRQVSFDGRYHYAHRLAWLYVHGQLPAGQIDHINGNRSDNRMENLRDVSHGANQHNRKDSQTNGKVPFLGVSLCKRTNRYRAQIKAHGRVRSLGYYDTPETASEAYQAAKLLLHEGAVA